MVSLARLIDDAKCLETIRGLRWPAGVACPGCGSRHIALRGKDDTQPDRQRSQCKTCGKQLDDLTDTIFAGRHQPLRIWILCLYLRGLNLSNEQIAQELDLDKNAVQNMTCELRSGVLERKAHAAVGGRSGVRRSVGRGRTPGKSRGSAQKGRPPRRRRLRGARGRGTLAKEAPPIFGMFQRGGAVAIRMLANVPQATIAPLLQAAIALGATVHTDEYDIYSRLAAWGYDHQTVCPSPGEHARDDDGDGFCEVHVNTIEGFWSLLRSWLRPHRSVSQAKLPLYLGFFEFVQDVRRRGKTLRCSLRQLLLTPPP